MIVGLAFLITGFVGIALSRRHFLMLKRTNPEVIDDLKAEGARTRDAEKTLSLRDLPPWLTIILIVVVVVGFLGGDLHMFAFNPVLETFLFAVTVFLVISYFAYKRKLMKKKYPE
jgi:predicted lysophospholipase L1 biosynthesis ABC-type transport system permease subunit